LRKAEFHVMGSYSPDQAGRTRGLGKEGGWNRSRAAVTQTSKASWAGAGFFYFFARNPLKSPDSAKEIKGNASVFVWFCLPFLASNSPSGCLQG
jgi:hypothetical protein